MEVGRVYTTNKVILREKEREGKKKYKISLFNILLKSLFVNNREENCFLVSCSSPGLSQGFLI